MQSLTLSSFSPFHLTSWCIDCGDRVILLGILIDNNLYICLSAEAYINVYDLNFFQFYLTVNAVFLVPFFHREPVLQ